MSKDKKTEKPAGPFDATLNAIKVASQTLNRAADEASLEIEALDQQLSEIDPGVSVWTAVLLQEQTTFADAHGPKSGVRTLKLGYRKGKKGGLVVSDDAVATDGTLLQHEELALRKADRETRLLVRAHLSDLLNLILSALTSQVARLPIAQAPEPELPIG